MGTMTDTVVRIEAVRYGLLEFATLVVHDTQGMDALLLIPSIMHNSVGEKDACWPCVLVVGSSGSCKLVVMYMQILGCLH